MFWFYLPLGVGGRGDLTHLRRRDDSFLDLRQLTQHLAFRSVNLSLLIVNKGRHRYESDRVQCRHLRIECWVSL